jgi:hypothetical protein
MLLRLASLHLESTDPIIRMKPRGALKAHPSFLRIELLQRCCNGPPLCLDRFALGDGMVKACKRLEQCGVKAACTRRGTLQSLVW